MPPEGDERESARRTASPGRAACARPAPATDEAETLPVPEFIPPGREPPEEEPPPPEPDEAPTVVDGGEQLTLADEENAPRGDRPPDG